MEYPQQIQMNERIMDFAVGENSLIFQTGTDGLFLSLSFDSEGYTLFLGRIFLLQIG